MKITGISRKITHGHYENTSLFAEVEEGDNIQDCYDKLTADIYLLSGNESKAKHLQSDIDYLEKRISNLQEDESTALKRKAEVEAWLKKFNIPFDAFAEGEIPF